MSENLPIRTVNDYNELVGAPTRHPLVSVVDFSTTTNLLPGGKGLQYGFYTIYLKTAKACVLRYGRHTYDYQAGTLVFLAPGQVLSVEADTNDYQPIGHALLFHPDLLRGTTLGQVMPDFHFFSYSVHEALHLSDSEVAVVLECFRKIDYEVKHAIDKHSKKLIVANIDLFLGYCERFYDRQFLTRGHASTGAMDKFESLLTDYFRSERPQSAGVPSVAFFADAFHLSPNYFGDLIKKETGKTAQDHIHARLIDEAKDRIAEPGKTVSEIAYELGFKYPQHFIRFFKQQVGHTPTEYRLSAN